MKQEPLALDIYNVVHIYVVEHFTSQIHIFFRKTNEYFRFNVIFSYFV